MSERKVDILNDIANLMREKYGAEVGFMMMTQLFQKYAYSSWSVTKKILLDERAFLKAIPVRRMGMFE